MKNKNLTKLNIIKKFVIYNIIIVSFIFFSFKYFELGLMIIFGIGAYPLFDYLFTQGFFLSSNDELFLLVFIIWTLIVFNFWGYLFIRNKKGGRKKEVIALIIYLILMSILWFIWIAFGVFSL